MKFPNGKYTEEQQAWCALYEARTGFDPLMDDFEAGNEAFYQAAQKSARWFEDHANDAMNAVSRNIPGEDAALLAELEARDAAPSITRKTMTSKERILAKHPGAIAVREVGTFAGGRIRYVVKLSATARKAVGYGQRESWAWADARRALGL